MAGTTINVITVNDLDFIPCQNCGYCTTRGVCKFADKDDMKAVYEAIDEADRLVAASPIYFANVTAQLKSLIDRCQVYWARKFVMKEQAPSSDRKGILLSVGGFGHRGFWPCTQKLIRTWFVCCDIEYLGGLFYHNVDAKGDIEKHPSALDEARETGRRLIAGEGPDPAAAGAR